MNCAIIDVMGIYGSIFHYALVIAFVGSAALIFFTLWKKKRLDMDEEPKFQMLFEDQTDQGDENNDPKRD